MVGTSSAPQTDDSQASSRELPDSRGWRVRVGGAVTWAMAGGLDVAGSAHSRAGHPSQALTWPATTSTTNTRSSGRRDPAQVAARPSGAEASGYNGQESGSVTPSPRARNGWEHNRDQHL